MSVWSRRLEMPRPMIYGHAAQLGLANPTYEIAVLRRDEPKAGTFVEIELSSPVPSVVLQRWLGGLPMPGRWWYQGDEPYVSLYLKLSERISLAERIAEQLSGHDAGVQMDAWSVNHEKLLPLHYELSIHEAETTPDEQLGLSERAIILGIPADPAWVTRWERHRAGLRRAVAEVERLFERKTGRARTDSQPIVDFARLNVAAWWEDGPKDQDSLRNMMWFMTEGEPDLLIWYHRLPDPELDVLSAVSAQLSPEVRTEPAPAMRDDSDLEGPT